MEWMNTHCTSAVFMLSYGIIISRSHFMPKDEIKVYGYRWVVLVAFMLVVIINQLCWISFASITSESAAFYHTDPLNINLLALVFMAVYVIVSFPASWAIDTWGVRIAVGIGAVLTAGFALMRGLVGANFNLVMIAQVGIAIGQPFLLNAITTVAARWFPLSERATAAGLGTLATYLGIMAGLAVTPLLTPSLHIPGTLTMYGIIAIAFAVLFFIFWRERPATPPCPKEAQVRSLVLDGLKDTLRNKQFWLLMFVFFIGLGAFNAVTALIEQVVGPRGFNSQQAGIAGGIMILGGVVGALVMPTISDKIRKRVPFIIIALAGTSLGLAGVTFVRSSPLLYTASFVMGFFLLSAGPIGFTYGAELTYPTPEGTSNGLLILSGQVSGIIFILAMSALTPAGGNMAVSLVVLIALLVLSLILSFLLREAKNLLIGTPQSPPKQASKK
jgi:MFS family permease